MKKQSMAGFKRSAQAGFTLIELVVVIVILGILAATALPKFADMGGDARLAKIQAARAAVQTGSAMVHSLWLTRGSPANGNLALEGTNVAHVNGYPAGTAAGIEIAAGGLADYVRAFSGTTVTISTDTGHPNCAFTYTGATSAGTPAVITEPTIAAAPTLANCN